MNTKTVIQLFIFFIILVFLFFFIRNTFYLNRNQITEISESESEIFEETTEKSLDLEEISDNSQISMQLGYGLIQMVDDNNEGGNVMGLLLKYNTLKFVKLLNVCSSIHDSTQQKPTFLLCILQ